jgi:hypothetical protein
MKTLAASLTEKELPTWLSLVTQVVFKIGVPSAIAIYLVYIGATNIPDLRMELAAQRREVQQLQVSLMEIRQRADETYLMAQWICSNTSKSETAARACFNP